MCWNKEMHDKPSLRKQNLSHFHQVIDILIMLLSLFICFYSAITSLYEHRSVHARQTERNEIGVQ